MTNKIKLNWFKYLSPVFGILFCPATIIFFWSIWSIPEIESEIDFVEEIQP